MDKSGINHTICLGKEQYCDGNNDCFITESNAHHLSSSDESNCLACPGLQDVKEKSDFKDVTDVRTLTKYVIEHAQL